MTAVPPVPPVPPVLPVPLKGLPPTAVAPYRSASRLPLKTAPPHTPNAPQSAVPPRIPQSAAPPRTPEVPL
ncbi:MULTISPECIES: hypothetical protein [Streptomyces]|uniref:hypothetical protein n=1 Tax=Streptomyces TaxID=1883 RepID=UPI0003A9344A|nr:MULTISPECIES: hypothetical protein [Streptomyces]MBZ6111092.1 hypothetical protein [Streptomyces olivaceus]MBZ6127652.1 hypothetical protein [Streptomyces olivaceus]MBZ6145428.1 hypothetical protein [Streptomyces olivaceus]MBZ6159566.1 hypothetical protein [Streptomyces olivaceus]MBZ6187343.1 hypothetical protein [Streptomyces olivaceus]